jgi:hypothetical protein
MLTVFDSRQEAQIPMAMCRGGLTFPKKLSHLSQADMIPVA